MTKAPEALTCASIVFWETMQIALLVVALNNIEIYATEFLDAYIILTCCKKSWSTLQREFGDNYSQKAIVA